MSENNLVKIEPLLIHPKQLKPGIISKFTPNLVWIKPEELSVDRNYQRNLSKQSVTLIRKIIREWSWSAYKPPIVTKYENEQYYIIDGQHTSIAAATHPEITTIPVLVVEKMQQEKRAESFIRHNIDRITVNPIELFKAKLEAGDDTATSINMALQRSGVELSLLNHSVPKPRQLSCLKTLENVLNKYGLMALRKTLDVCVDAELIPIQSYYVIAVSDLLYHNKYKDDKYDPDGISLVIREYPYNKLCADVEYQARSGNTTISRKTKNYIATELIKQAYQKRFYE